MSIPIIDLFAGPGGLNEGFSRVRDSRGRCIFQTLVSVECDKWAHQTLELRALYRRLEDLDRLAQYRRYARGEISRDELFVSVGSVGADARNEAMLATLGTREDNGAIENRIACSLRELGNPECVLIGGPPCQAYSLVGRARRTHDSTYSRDHKHVLYREYLNIVRRFRPAVFLMENVPGLLSARFQGNGTFEMICTDLRQAGYDIHPLGGEGPSDTDPRRFVISADQFGVPQSRSRIFILGLRADLRLSPLRLTAPSPAVFHTVGEAISDLPRIRSRISRTADTGLEWVQEIASAFSPRRIAALDEKVRDLITRGIAGLHGDLPIGSAFVDQRAAPAAIPDWYLDSDCGVLNHNSRGHMAADLHRYFYWSTYGAVYQRSPTLSEVPRFLLPNHVNIHPDEEVIPFSDRFRVQIRERPSTTIVSHIAKDGHYYIHPDPSQCRSLSVREAARLQTFPDSYRFEGPTTEQYKQVGNAVPPYLASQIGTLIRRIMR